MKRLLLLALCALLSLNAGARTLYVDAKRPNNKGNGLSAKKAKKTIQAAINAAKKGDTILVFPGTYSAIRTKNKAIAIKSVKGKGRTTVKAKSSLWKSTPVLDLGNGVSTKVRGFRISNRRANCAGGARGGIVSNSSFDGLGQMYNFDYDNDFGNSTFFKTTLRDCVLSDCLMGTSDSAVAYRSELSRCRVSGCAGNGSSHTGFYGCALSNCLVEGNDDLPFTSCTIVNCTVVDGWASLSLRKNKAVNTLFAGVAPKQFGANRRNTLKYCYKGTSPCFVDEAAGDFRLAKGSPCINKGKLTKAQKKLVGTKDLAGRKRIRGKAIDIGCYEY